MTIDAEWAEILLIDDSADDIAITLNIFARAGMPNLVQVVRSGEEALRYLNREGEYKFRQMPELVLMDINMPALDGFATLREIKASQRLRHIPVIMLTTSNRREDILEAYRIGCSSYIPKPGTPAEFREALDVFVRYWSQVSRIPPAEEEP